MINTIEKIDNIAQMQSRCGMKDANKNDVDFEKIVKFLNAQKAALDYAGLN